MFKVSWNKAILQENPAKMKGKKLRVCFTTLVDKDSLSPYTETVEQCFIRPVQPEYLNKGFVFERGSVVDAYAHAGWWKSVIVKEVPNDKFLVYFDFIPDIAKFDKYQLRPNADWTGSKWAMFSSIFFAKYILGDIVEVFVSCGWRQGEVREILCGNKYLVQFKAAKEEAVYKSSALRPSMDWQDGRWIHTRERESIEETHSKGTSKSKNDDATPLISPQESPSNTHVLDGAEDDLINDAPIATHESSSSTLVLESNEDEILTPEESYSNTTVLEATENPISYESGDTMNDDATSPIINPQEIPIDGTEDYLINDAPTPTIATQERSSITLVLESNEDDMMNGYATEIITPEESYSNTPILEATNNETPINEAVVVDVKCILGDSEMHSDLVEDVDIQFGRVVDIVKRGYRLKRQDWINGSVNIAVAEAEIEKNNYGPGIDATDKEKNEFLNNQVEILKERVEYLENLLNIRRETEKDGELNENASKEHVLLKRKKQVRENKGAYASTSNSKKQKKQSGVPADVVI
ncbi:hypothetical protein Bca52824_001109 [Brassica carinata]|uniref:Agenet domain-containing protein n=1 Tax=Brassica carinata TaxID=52824 RepID=A0A8X7WHP8_BRACI|nr:hypothetical protein Bca52824_001109 [Brassica carinata]